MLFCTITAAVSLIATFASHTPPPAVKRPFRVHNTRSNYEVWITPVRNDYSTLAYTTCDDHIHYFQYTFENAIVQSVWTTRLSISERAAVFGELKEWYHNISNSNLTLNTTNVDDMVSWYVANQAM